MSDPAKDADEATILVVMIAARLQSTIQELAREVKPFLKELNTSWGDIEAIFFENLDHALRSLKAVRFKE